MKRYLKQVIIFLMINSFIFTLCYIHINNTLFGYKPYIVLSNSMENIFKAGDIVVIKEINPYELNNGDVISFISEDENSKGEIITHKIRTIDFKNKKIITYGTKNNINDKKEVSFNNVTGKYIFKIPFVGNIFILLKSKIGFIFIVLIICLIINVFILMKSLCKYFKLKKKILINDN